MEFLYKNRLSHGSHIFGRTKKVIKVGKISERYGILTVEEKRTSLIGFNTKVRLCNYSKANKVRGETVEGVQY